MCFRVIALVRSEFLFLFPLIEIVAAYYTYISYQLAKWSVMTVEERDIRKPGPGLADRIWGQGWDKTPPNARGAHNAFYIYLFCFL